MSAQAGWSGSGQDAGGIANPAAAAQEVLRAFTNLVASSSRSKADLRDFEKLLVSCDDRCMSALLAHPQLWPLLRASLSNYESQWDVLGLLLNRLSMEAEGRKQAMAQGYINMMGELLAVRGPQARADKAIERLGNLACMLSVLCTDASVAQLPWLHSVCMGVRNSLDRSQIKNASGRVVMEAYAQLSAFINFLYTSVPSLARHIATCFINCSESTPLLFRVAKRLVDEPGLTGATKIVAEKSLVVLSKLSAEAPDTRFIPNQIEPWGLCHFLIKCARDCSWVQSQDSAITFLARIVFQQRHVTLDFLDLPGAAVLDTLRKAMGHKSIALRATAAAFASLCPAATFYELVNEFEAALDALAGCPTRTLRTVVWEAARGIWGMGCELSLPAAAALRQSRFLEYAADTCPVDLPRCLVQLLPDDVQERVEAAQEAAGSAAADDARAAAAEPQQQQDVQGRGQAGGGGGAGGGGEVPAARRTAAYYEAPVAAAPVSEAADGGADGGGWGEWPDSDDDSRSPSPLPVLQRQGSGAGAGGGGWSAGGAAGAGAGSGQYGGGQHGVPGGRAPWTGSNPSGRQAADAYPQPGTAGGAGRPQQPQHQAQHQPQQQPQPQPHRGAHLASQAGGAYDPHPGVWGAGAGAAGQAQGRGPAYQHAAGHGQGRRSDAEAVEAVLALQQLQGEQAGPPHPPTTGSTPRSLPSHPGAAAGFSGTAATGFGGTPQGYGQGGAHTQAGALGGEVRAGEKRPGRGAMGPGYGGAGALMGEAVQAGPAAQEEGQGVGGGGAAPKRQRLMGSYATLAVTGGAQATTPSQAGMAAPTRQPLAPTQPTSTGAHYGSGPGHTASQRGGYPAKSPAQPGLGGDAFANGGGGAVEGHAVGKLGGGGGRGAGAMAPPSLSEDTRDDIGRLNQVVDQMYRHHAASAPLGQAIIKRLAEGAANLSVIGFLRTFPLPSPALTGLDPRVNALHSRARLVHSGFSNNEPLDLLLPFAELLAAESGILRRSIETQAQAAGVPATATEAAPSLYDGGASMRYSVY